ncbi:hypothetical protein VTN02DRAFT_1529 [Thermoascus thermophilus]
MAPALGFTKGPSWVHESPFLPIGWEEGSRLGAPSLKHLAMRKTLRDQRNLTPELFANVPWHIASYLWECLGRSRKRTMYMWKLFATAYPREFRQIADYRAMKIEGPRLPMRDYLGLVKDDALNWAVALTLSTEFARTPELVDIGKVRNIVALEISTTPSKPPPGPDEDAVPVAVLDDRIVRTWSELAQTSGAFQHLRVLRVYHQEQLSPIVFQYFRVFPALRVLVVQDCRGLTPESAEAAARTHGWEIGAAKHRDEETDIYDSDTVYECYAASGTLLDGRREEPSIDPDTPILDFQVGQAVRGGVSRKARKLKPTVFLRKGFMADQTMGKRRSEAPEPPNRKRTSTPRMKKLGGKDLAGFLAEFL